MPINKWMDQQTAISVNGKTQQKKKNKTKQHGRIPNYAEWKKPGRKIRAYCKIPLT